MIGTIAKATLCVVTVLIAAPVVSAQTQTQTNCTTSPDYAGGSTTNCSSTSTTSKPSGGAAQGVADALKNRPQTDWVAMQKWKDAKNERRFEEDKNGIEQIRSNYATHQNSGEALSKETIKAFNAYRRDACKVQKWLPNPVSLDNIIRDLDGTPRSCREVSKIK